MRRAVTPVGAATLLLAVLAVVVFGNSWGSVPVDIKPEVYLAPDRALSTWFQSWTSSPYLGSPNFNVGLTPVLGLLAVLRWIGFGPEVTFKIFHLLLWAFAALGAGRLLRTLVPRAAAWAGVAAGAAYLLNPYAVTAGSTLAIALPFALLPWQSLAIVRALEAPRSWTWPALVGLTFFLMTGMNAAVVPIIQTVAFVPVLALVVGRSLGRSWGVILLVLAKCGLFVLGVSLYWLVPAATATGTATQIIAGSETLEGIAKVSSLTEVLRGLGLWALYGRSAQGPWVPEYAVFLTSPVAVVVTGLWAVLALFSVAVAPRRLRRVAALGIAVAAVVMVGLYPARGSSPVGWLFAWLFEHVPVLAAFRTTNKVGSVLTLCFALALGYAAAQVLPRLTSRPGWGPFVVFLVPAMLFAWAVPAFTGRLYISHIDVPGYWRQAAAEMDAGSPDSRVLFLPGQTRAHYRWTPERPDDVATSLMSREAIIPETTPNTSAPGANLLAALDDTVQSGAATGRVVSTMAALLGAGQVLLRHDITWEAAGGAPPRVTDAALNSDPGLRGRANFGAPGQNIIGPGATPQSLAEAQLPPLQLYDVRAGASTVRAQPLAGSTLLIGDGWGVAAAARAGLLDGTTLLRYAADLASLASGPGSALGPDRRIVLTDTNARRDAITNRLTAGQGATLPADTPPGVSRSLGGADDQSVLVRTGATVTASASGGAFFDTPYGAPDNLIDGDAGTNWLFGDFGHGVGVSARIRFVAPQAVGVVRIAQADVGSARVAQVEVEAGGVTRTVDLPDRGFAEVDLDGVRADGLRVTVTTTRGNGYNLVGLAEVEIEGVRGGRVTRLPRTLDRLYAALDATGKAEFARTPLDILLTRVAATVDPADDTETGLDRDLTLPDARTYAATARVRLTDLDDQARDVLAGWDPSVTARSSATFFGRPEYRASFAVDGSGKTAWVPGGDLAKAWWEVTGPARVIPRIVLEQTPGLKAATQGTTRAVTEVAVDIDGRRVRTAALTMGRNVIGLPSTTTGRTVRISVLRATGVVAASPPQFPLIDAGVRLVRASAPACLSVATVDGGSLRMRPVDPAALAGTTDAGTAWTGCATLALGPREHAVRRAAGVQIDSLDLRDVSAPPARAGSADPAPAAVPLRQTGLLTDRTITLGRDGAGVPEPTVLTLGQGWDPRWRAVADGVDLGAAVVVNGHSSGWVLPAGAKVVHVRYGPQVPSWVALGLSALVLLLSLALSLRYAVARTSRTAPSAARPSRRLTPGAHIKMTSAIPVLGPVLLAGLTFGVPGALGAAVAVGAGRSGFLRRRLLAGAGALVVLAGIILQMLLGRDFWGEINADAIAGSMWPHRIAACGLTLALVASFLPSPQDREAGSSLTAHPAEPAPTIPTEETP